MRGQSHMALRLQSSDLLPPPFDLLYIFLFLNIAIAYILFDLIKSLLPICYIPSLLLLLFISVKKSQGRLLLLIVIHSSLKNLKDAENVNITIGLFHSPGCSPNTLFFF